MGDEYLHAIFCGEVYFQHTFPSDPSDFVHFRGRIGQEGVAKIFAYSVAIHELDGRVKQALGVKITTPDNPKASDSEAKRRRMRRRFRRRAGIKAIIGHLKTDHRMGQNYLHGNTSFQINAYLAAAGWSLKKWMEQWVRERAKSLRLLCMYLIRINPYQPI
ncbi:hypothetical protein ACG2F4_18995 [Halalkalibaculum sp. DA3122]|uniref:hypothetical protein n=1 Tax=unclassified Halalkalibaculum TaxID=2964617 RepID=UPI00375446AE